MAKVFDAAAVESVKVAEFKLGQARHVGPTILSRRHERRERRANRAL